MFTGLYFLYRDPNFTKRKAETTLATLLVVIAAIMAQEFLLPRSSVLGYLLFQSIQPFVGIAGYLILNLLVFLLALHLYFEISMKTFEPLKEKLKSLLKKEPSEEMVTKEDVLAAVNTVSQDVKEEIDSETAPQNSVEPEPAEKLNYEKEQKEETGSWVTLEHEDEIAKYLERKKLEILEVDPSVMDDLSSKRKVNILVTEQNGEHQEHSTKNEPPIQNDKEELEDVFEDNEPESVEKKAPKKREKPVAKTPVVKEENEQPKASVKIVKELEENKKLQDELEKGDIEKPKDFKLPPLDFLGKSISTKKEVNEAEIDAKIADLLEKLKVFKIEGDIVRTYAGPVVTTFEFRPAPNVKVSKILNLEDDIAMALKAQTIRIQAPIPGKDVVGIEIPNVEIETIYLRDLLENQNFQKASSPLTMVLGKDIVGNPFITDLRKLPHLLIAGTTGSGKSVGINGMILSLLYRNSPDKLKFLMVDPKMLEFSIYNDIPHLLTPVITQPKQAIYAMANMVVEMERRYALMAKTKTKTLESYNEKAKREGNEEMPFIVVVIDELADLMMQGGKEVEISIARLAQKARACGIHLIIATQRPSTDVITGLIKANLPSRLSYRVGSKIDSKVILDQMGADSLLGRGDLLFTPPGTVGLVRLHAPWSTEGEIDKVVDFLKHQREAEYDHTFLEEGGDTAGGSDEKSDFSGVLDALYEDARKIVINERKTSISYIQRKLGIGYNRSANIIEQLEHKGVLSAPNAKGQREVIA